MEIDRDKEKGGERESMICLDKISTLNHKVLDDTTMKTNARPCDNRAREANVPMEGTIFVALRHTIDFELASAKLSI